MITLNVNGLIFPIKRCKLAEGVQKHDKTRSCLQETHFTHKDLTRLKWNYGKDILCKQQPKWTEMIINIRENQLNQKLVFEKIDKTDTFC